MPNAERFAYRTVTDAAGEMGLVPHLPLILTQRESAVSVFGLLDTGASVNVMPYHVGVELGAVWDEQARSVNLSGNLARYEARILLASASVGAFVPVILAFAWTRADHIPLILGQTNFFAEFDVCFYRSQQAFDVRPKL